MTDELDGEIRRFLAMIEDATPSAPDVAVLLGREHLRSPDHHSATNRLAIAAAITAVVGIGVLAITTRAHHPTIERPGVPTVAEIPTKLTTTTAPPTGPTDGPSNEAAFVAATASILGPTTERSESSNQNGTTSIPRIIGTFTLPDGQILAVGLTDHALCLILPDGTVGGCDERPRTPSPAFFMAAGNGRDDTTRLVYGVADPGLAVSATASGTSVTVTQTTESVDGHLAFISIVPAKGELMIELADSSGTTVKRYDNVSR